MVLASPCVAAEPQAAFLLQDGWIELTLKKDGQPIAGAAIEVNDERGVHFAEGETDSEGRASFPMPRGAACSIEIKSGKRTADPIRLVKMGSRVEPARVLLSYGLRPCCRFKLGDEPAKVAAAEAAPEPPQAAPHWLAAGAALGVLSLAAALVCLALRPRTPLSAGQ